MVNIDRKLQGRDQLEEDLRKTIWFIIYHETVYTTLLTCEIIVYCNRSKIFRKRSYGTGSVKAITFLVYSYPYIILIRTNIKSIRHICS
ncbi:putative integral membrane protein [Acanthocheilonema viteae]